jgi:hypothetical protein
MIDMRDFTSVFLAILSACVCMPAVAFTPNVPEHGLPSAADYSATLLPELQGVVSWKTLAQVEPIKRNGKVILSFSSQILALDSQLVRINGFMLPLDMTDQQKHFLISAVPSSCPFCMPAGPEAIVEVTSKAPIKFGFEPMIMVGKFAVLKNDRSGLLYRMTDAELVNTSVK